MKVYDPDGNEIADFALSPRQEQALKAGEETTMLFHTPQLFRSTLGQLNGAFTLRQIGERVVTSDIDSVRAYAAIQTAVKRAMRERQDGGT
jgi:hypothetical protein